MALYFAYGSNMDELRMINRGMTIHNKWAGKLEGYRLVFNKKSQKYETQAFGNIEADHNSQVEGIVYEVDSLPILDKHEGYPKHYNRTEMDIKIGSGFKKCWVYIAQPEWVDNNLKPSKEYLSHYLKGKDYLSKEYYEFLKSVKCLDE